MPNDIIKLSNKEFETLRPINNNVIIEIIHRNENDTTKSGLVLVTDYNKIIVHDAKAAEEYDCSQHLDRWGKVVKICDKLHFNKYQKPLYTGWFNPNFWKMDWDTEIEIKEGDLVWADYHSLHHCPIIQVEEKQYWVVNYQNLIAAKRLIRCYDLAKLPENGIEYIKKYNTPADSEYYDIIPLNGYCLFERTKEELKQTGLILEQKIDKGYGIVKYVGNKNKEYTNLKKFDDIDVKPGDKVIFKWDVENLLENSQHRFFDDCDLRYEQRCNIIGIETN